MSRKIVTVKRVMLDELVPSPINANVMSADVYERLVSSIKELGPDLQPPLVRMREDGRYDIVDGHHRIDAARAAGMHDLLVIIVDLSDEESKVLQLGMNRMRGELDLGLASTMIGELVELGTPMDVLMLAGFGEEELSALLAATRDDPPEPTVLPEPEAPRPPAPFLLELTFENRTDLARARRALKRAAGKGNELSAGLLRMIDGT
jgi:ParB-like chromosome segregation protein Spo0J